MVSDLHQYLSRQGYTDLRELWSGEIAGLHKMMYTTGLVVGLTRTSWRTRFCFDQEEDARTALLSWDGTGWPPGYWVKQKPEEVHGPGSTVPMEHRR